MQFDLEAGVGLATGQGSNPKAMLEISNDGGHTYGNKRQIDIGKVGEYDKRAKPQRLGQSRKRVWRLTYSEPTAFTILSMEAEFR